MLVVFSPIFVMGTHNFVDDFVAPLIRFSLTINDKQTMYFVLVSKTRHESDFPDNSEFIVTG